MTSIVSWLIGAAPQANSPLDDRFYEVSTGTLSRAGIRVSPETALKVSTVYRCVSIVSNALAMFPKGMYENLERGRRKATEHPLDAVISFKANRRQNAFVFWRQLCFHLALRQNAYAQIVPGFPGRGWVGGLIPLHPDRIRGPEELSDGRLRYEYARPNGEKVKLIGDIDIWHLTGLSDDGLKGLSMMDLAADTFGTAVAAERHTARFFERGINFAGILHHPRSLKADTAKEMSESFGRTYGGEAGSGKVPVLWEGMEFKPISMTLKDAEFLESRKFGVAEIARWFGVPPHMVGDVERSTSWGTGIEQQGLHFLIYCLLPWIELLEQSIKFSLVVQPERFYPKLNPGALLRMDQEAQARVFSALIDKGVLSPNECRELLDRNPREGGDEYVDVTKPAAPPVARPALRPAPDPDEEEEDEDQEAARAAEVAGRLAKASAAELLTEEGRGLSRLAKEHARNEDAWRSAVAGFYGRFAGRVSSGMVCSKVAAKGWCETRRGIVIADGLAGLTESEQEEAATTLMQLALANGGLHD